MRIVAVVRAAVLQEHCIMRAMLVDAVVVEEGVAQRLARARRAEVACALHERECGMQQCAHVRCIGAKR